jgi:hypothetical protein
MNTEYRRLGPVVAALALVARILSSAVAERQAAKRPNVLFVAVDETQRQL